VEDEIPISIVVHKPCLQNNKVFSRISNHVIAVITFHSLSTRSNNFCSALIQHSLLYLTMAGATTAPELPKRGTYPTPVASLTQTLKRAADGTLHKKDDCSSWRPSTDIEKSWYLRSPLPVVRITRTSFPNSALFRDYKRTLHRIDATENGSTVK
jgi:hypothetical protein